MSNLVENECFGFCWRWAKASITTILELFFNPHLYLFQGTCIVWNNSRSNKYILVTWWWIGGWLGIILGWKTQQRQLIK